MRSAAMPMNTKVDVPMISSFHYTIPIFDTSADERHHFRLLWPNISANKR